jgi:hypothetical protein
MEVGVIRGAVRRTRKRPEASELDSDDPLRAVERCVRRDEARRPERIAGSALWW